MAVVLDGEEWEVCDQVEAEVGLFQAAKASQCAHLHPCDLIVEKDQVFQPPQPLEVVLLHHLELVRGQVQNPDAGGVVKDPMFQGAELVMGHPEVFQPGKLGEAALTQPGQLVVAEVEGDRVGRQETRRLGQTAGAAADGVRYTQTDGRTGQLSAREETEQRQD